eukprot:s2742_g4.t7
MHPIPHSAGLRSYAVLAQAGRKAPASEPLCKVYGLAAGGPAISAGVADSDSVLAALCFRVIVFAMGCFASKKPDPAKNDQEERLPEDDEETNQLIEAIAQRIVGIRTKAEDYSAQLQVQVAEIENSKLGILEEQPVRVNGVVTVGYEPESSTPEVPLLEAREGQEIEILVREMGGWAYCRRVGDKTPGWLPADRIAELAQLIADHEVGDAEGLLNLKLGDVVEAIHERISEEDLQLELELFLRRHGAGRQSRLQKCSNTKASMQARIAEKMAQRDNAENAWMGWIYPRNEAAAIKDIATTAITHIVDTEITDIVADVPAVNHQAAAHLLVGSWHKRSRKMRRMQSAKLCSTYKTSERWPMGRSAGSRKLACGQREKQKAFRKLLREWHPDKNPERVKMATEVFQFLQKAAKMFKC